MRKLLSALSHGSIFFSSTFVSLGLPILILFLTEDSVVKANAREALHFYINLYLYAFIFIILSFVLIGIPLLVLLFIVSFVMPIIAIISVLDQPDRPYQYPFLVRLF